VGFLNIKLRLIAALWQAPATLVAMGKRPYLVNTASLLASIRANPCSSVEKSSQLPLAFLLLTMDMPPQNTASHLHLGITNN
jgi:hypothetical protein